MQVAEALDFEGKNIQCRIALAITGINHKLVDTILA